MQEQGTHFCSVRDILVTFVRNRWGEANGQTRPARSRTRESLHKALISLALEKHYDSITVQEVLDRADVGARPFIRISKAWMNCSFRALTNFV